MNTIPFDGYTVLIAEHQPQYNPIPAYHSLADGKLVFCWQLTPEEIQKIQQTGVLWHEVMTFNHPLQPQKLSTEKPDIPVSTGVPHLLSGKSWILLRTAN